MADYGFNFNCAATVKEDGKCSVGVHLTDSDGLDINREASGEDLSSVISSLGYGVIKEMNSTNSKKAEMKANRVKELQDKIDALNNDIAGLEAELETLNASTKVPTRKSTVNDRDLRYLLRVFGF